MEFYFVSVWMDVLAIFQCGSIAYEWTCTWSWSWEYETTLPRVKEFDKTQSEVKLHMKVWEWKSNFGFGRNFYYFEEASYWWVFLKEIPSTLQGRSWFPSSNHTTLVNYLDSMGSLWRYLFTRTRKKARNKEYASLTMELLECTKWLARFIEFSFSDQRRNSLN